MEESQSRGLRARSRSPSPPSPSSLSSKSPLVLERRLEPEPFRQPASTLSPRLFLALIVSSALSSDLLARLARRSNLTVLFFPFWTSASLFLISCYVRSRYHSSKAREGFRRCAMRALSPGAKGEQRWEAWATGLTFVGLLMLRMLSLRQSGRVEVQWIDILVLPVWLSLRPFLSRTLRLSDVSQPRLLHDVSLVVSFLVGTALVGNSGLRSGVFVALLRIPIEALHLTLLESGLRQDEGLESNARLDWMFGSTVVASAVSYMLLGLIFVLPAPLDTSTFSTVAFLLSSILPVATILLYVVFHTALMFNLASDINPLLSALHVLPRNLLGIASCSFMGGLAGNWSQLLLVYSGGSATLISFFGFHQEERMDEADLEKKYDVDVKSKQPSRKTAACLALVPLAFAFPCAVMSYGPTSLSGICSLIPTSLRPYACPSQPDNVLSRTVDVVVSYYDEDLGTTRKSLDYVRKIYFVTDRQSRVIVYNKGEKEEAVLRGALGLQSWDSVVRLENVGREGATYLQHILRNYNVTLAETTTSVRTASSSDTFEDSSARTAFADHTFFLQPHLAWSDIAKPRMWTIPSDVGFASFGPLRLAIDGEDQGHGSYPLIKTIYNMFRGRLSPPEGSVISWSAQFIASRYRILSNDYSAYKALDDMIEAPADHWLHHLWGPDNSGGPSNPTFGHSVERAWPIVFDCADPHEISPACFDSDPAGYWHNCLCRDT